MMVLARQRRTALIVAGLILVLAGIFLLSRVSASNPKNGTLRSAIEVMALVKTQYVDPVNLVDLVGGYVQKGTINGMLKTLKDPYTRYMDPSAYQQMQIDTEGVYGGIGIYIGMSEKNELTVIAPIEGTPGARAGIKAGDKIRLINGKPTKDMSSDEAASLMKGPKGTEVTITIERGKELKEIRIVRDTIKVPSVESKMLPDHIGYVKLAIFQENSAVELEKALDKLEEEKMQGLIMDLRFNPGGLLNVGLEVANKFIDKGPLLHVVGRDRNKKTFYANPGKAHPDYPMVVLVNKGSASASEIVSGALKDTKRATLVGSQTFGKGLVQTIIPLGDGSALSLTTQRYLTAGGHSIHLTGIRPDVIVHNPGDEAWEQELADQQKNGGIRPDTADKPDKSDQPAKKETVKKEPPKTDKEFKDVQLEEAVKVLKARIKEAAGAKEGRKAA